jgi:hypothetical protein
MSKKYLTVPERFKAKYRTRQAILSSEEYQVFAAAANEMWSKGFRHYGAKAVAEEMRYFWRTNYEDRKYKITNDFITMYGRVFAQENPDKKDLFTFKPLGIRRAATLPSVKNFVAVAPVEDLIVVRDLIEAELLVRDSGGMQQ